MSLAARPGRAARLAPGARVAAVLGLAIVASACSLVPVVGERSWGVATTNQLGESQTVTVTDRSGLVAEVEFDPADADVFGGPVTVPPAGPNALDITWTAAACDVETTIVVAKAGTGLAVDVTAAMGAEGCDAFGEPRAVRLKLAQPIAPGAVTFTQVTR